MIVDLAAPAIHVANKQALRLWGLDVRRHGCRSRSIRPCLPWRGCVCRGEIRTRQLNDRPMNTGTARREAWCSGPLPAPRICAVGQRHWPIRNTVLVIFDIGTEQAVAEMSNSAPPKRPRIDGTQPNSADTPVNTQAMAHELRTPIGAIIALAEMIETEQFGAIGDPRYRDYARDIGDSARLALGIVAGALEQDPANGSDLNLGFAELNVTDLINKSLRTVRQSAREAGIHLDSDLAIDLPNLIASAPGLMQILLNLLSNAIKFTPEGGTVSVSARVAPDSTLQITVCDTGVGMTGTEASVLIAEPEADGPARADSAIRRNRRHGIGFSLVRRLASAMSAEFEVTSTRGVGTRVTLTFPFAKTIPISDTRKWSPARAHRRTTIVSRHPKDSSADGTGHSIPSLCKQRLALIVRILQHRPVGGADHDFSIKPFDTHRCRRGHCTA